MARQRTARAAVTASAAKAALRIGELAAVTGLNPRLLRYYEDVGLLQPFARTDSGYRLYKADAVERLQFIRRARALGLSLADIREILRASDAGLIPCEHVVAAVERQLKAVADQIERLHALRAQLLALRSRVKEMVAAGSGLAGRPCLCLAEDAARTPRSTSRAKRGR